MINGEPLVREFFSLLKRHKRSVISVSLPSGVGVVTMYNWKSRNNPSLPLFKAALNELGYDLVIVRQSHTPYSGE